MKIDLRKALSLATVGVVLFTSCKKDKDTPAEQNISLRDKPVSEAKAYARGNWTIHYTFGGLTGSMKTVTSNSSLRLLTNDSLYLIFNNQSFAADLAQFEREETIFGYSSVLMKFRAQNNVAHEWSIDSKKGDTLVLMQNSTESVSFYMTPQQ
jgi:hypothetical protein